MPPSEDLFQSVEDYLNDISPVASPPTSPIGSASGSNRRRSGDRSQKPNSGSNDRQSIGSFEPRKLASSSITTRWVKTLNELCQKCPPPLPPHSHPKLATAGGKSGNGSGAVLGFLQPLFDTNPVSDGAQHFKVELKLWRAIMVSPEGVGEGAGGADGSQVKNNEEEGAAELVEKIFKDNGPYSSKKHAREAVAKVAVEWLEEEVEKRKLATGKIKGTRLAGGSGGKKGGENGVSVMDGWGLVVTEGDGKNWVGLLNNYVLKKRIALPEYTEYATYGNTFSCEVRIEPFVILVSGKPKLLLELRDRVFGDVKTRYANKKLAKTAAAKALMEYLRKQDPFLASVGNEIPSLESPGKKKKGLEAMSSSKTIEVTSDMGYREKLNYISPRLGMKTPEYKLEGSSGIYNVHLFFHRPYAESDMLVGPIKNIHGKDKAKTEIAKEACRFLLIEAEQLGFKIVGLEELKEETKQNEQKQTQTQQQTQKQSGTDNETEGEEDWADASEILSHDSYNGLMGEVSRNAVGVVGLEPRPLRPLQPLQPLQSLQLLGKSLQT